MANRPRQSKCLFLAQAFPPPMIGGSLVYYYYLLSACTAEDVIVVTGLEQDSAAFDARMPYTIIRSRWLWLGKGELSKRIKKILCLVCMMPVWILRHRVSVVHVGDGGWALAIAWFWARATRRSLMVTVHGEELAVTHSRRSLRIRRSLSKLNMHVYQKILQRCDVVQANSAFTKNLLGQLGIPDARIVLTTPGIDLSKTSCVKNIAPALASQLAGRRILLTVGRFTPRKGHAMVLHALAAVVRRFPEVIYVMVGGGSNRAYRGECEAIIRDAGLENHTLILEDLENEAVAWLYDACTLFIMANYTMPNGDTEGYGIVFLEAGFFGKPVIGGRAGGAVNAVDDGVTGFLVHAPNPEEIEQAIVRLLSDPDAAKRMGQAGKNKAIENNWLSKSQAYRDLIHREAFNRRPIMGMQSNAR